MRRRRKRSPAVDADGASDSFISRAAVKDSNIVQPDLQGKPFGFAAYADLRAASAWRSAAMRRRPKRNPAAEDRVSGGSIGSLATPDLPRITPDRKYGFVDFESTAAARAWIAALAGRMGWGSR